MRYAARACFLKAILMVFPRSCSYPAIIIWSMNLKWDEKVKDFSKLRLAFMGAAF